MVHFDRRTVNASSFATARAMVVRKDNWRIALEEALHAVLSGRDTGPDLLVLFASTAYSHDYPELVREAFHGSGAGCLVGCSARGVIANDDSHESSRASRCSPCGCREPTSAPSVCIRR